MHCFDASVNSQRMWDRINLLKPHEVNIWAHNADSEPTGLRSTLPHGTYVMLMSDDVMASENWGMAIYVVDENGAVVLCEDIGPPHTIHKAAQYATAADLLKACDIEPNEHGRDNSLYGLPPHLLSIQWETTMPNRFKRPPGPTEMIPDYVNAFYDTIGPKTFDRPVMLSFGCEKHPALGDHATFDVMVTWAQIEALEAVIERVRKQCAFESPVASAETSAAERETSE